MTRKHTKEGLPTFAEFSKRLRQARAESARRIREARREPVYPKVRDALRRVHGKRVAGKLSLWAVGGFASHAWGGHRAPALGSHDRLFPVAPGARSVIVNSIRGWAKYAWEGADRLPCGHQDALGESIDWHLASARYLESYCVTR